MPARKGRGRARAKRVAGTRHAGRGSGTSRGSASRGPPPRADKGDGEAAVQARIAALAEPSRSILACLHPMVVKHGTSLLPCVRYGFAIYKRGETMVLVAAPRKSYVTFGYTNDAGIDAEPLTFMSADDVDENKVAEIVGRLVNRSATGRTAV